MRTVWFLIAVFMVVTIGDAYTTWACLREPTPGWNVREANFAAAWLFGLVGLVPGLVVDGIVTMLVLGWLGSTKKVVPKFKVIFMLVAIAISCWAVHHNFQAMIEMGILR